MHKIPLDQIPAAHSMDTTWYGIDSEGRVGRFYTGESGALPDHAAAGPEAGRFDDTSVRRAEEAIGGAPDRYEPDLEAGCVHFDALFDRPWEYRAGRMPRRVLRLADLPPDVAAKIAAIRFPGRFRSGGRVDLTDATAAIQTWREAPLAEQRAAPRAASSWLAVDLDGRLAHVICPILKPERPGADPDEPDPELLDLVGSLAAEPDPDPAPGAEEDLVLHIDPADPIAGHLIRVGPAAFRLPEGISLETARQASGYRGWSEPYSALYGRRSGAALSWLYVEWHGDTMRVTARPKRTLLWSDLPAALQERLSPVHTPVRFDDTFQLAAGGGLQEVVFSRPPPPAGPRPRASWWPWLLLVALAAALAAVWL